MFDPISITIGAVIGYCISKCIPEKQKQNVSTVNGYVSQTSFERSGRIPLKPYN
jgi:uncharacterized membrane protein YqgA involved in biofilm formation